MLMIKTTSDLGVPQGYTLANETSSEIVILGLNFFFIIHGLFFELIPPISNHQK